MTFSKGYIYIIQIFRVRGENRSGFVLKKDFSGNGETANWLILPNVTQLHWDIFCIISLFTQCIYVTFTCGQRKRLLGLDFKGLCVRGQGFRMKVVLRMEAWERVNSRSASQLRL